MACWRRPMSPGRRRPRPRRWRRRPGSTSTCRPASSRASSGWRAPCSPRPTTSAGSTACCSTTRWTAERNERAAVIRRTIALLSRRRRRQKPALPSSCAPRTRSCSPSSAHSQVDWGLAVQKAQALRRQKKEEEAWKILLAEPEGAVVAKPDGWWEAPRQRLRGVAARQAQNGLRSRAQSWDAVRQCRQGRLIPGRLAGAAPPQGRQAGARPFRGARQGGRRPAEPRARPVLARPHPGGARQQGQGPGALPCRIGLFRHLPRPARTPEGRSRRAPPRAHAAGT